MNRDRNARTSKSGNAATPITPVLRGELTEADTEAIVQMALKRAALVGRLRDALEESDDPHALDLARELCGLVRTGSK